MIPHEQALCDCRKEDLPDNRKRPSGRPWDKKGVTGFGGGDKRRERWRDQDKKQTLIS